MLADGRISEEERSLINAEARRLHLSHAEVDRLIEKARQQREAVSNHALMSMPQLIAQPAAAVERYRELLSQMQQLARLGDNGRMAQIMETPGRTTDLEREVWQLLNARIAAQESDAPPATPSGG
jgi:hypothetical protein